MISSSSYFYNQISKLYVIIDLFLMHHKNKLIKLINKDTCYHVLEIGVGNGSHLNLYKNKNITGIDTSSNMLYLARKREVNNVQLLLMSGENLEFESNRFDAVIISHVLSVVDNPEKVFGQAKQVLKSKGKIYILNHFTPNNGLKWLDIIFNPISLLFRFKSEFYVQDFQHISGLKKIREIDLKPFSYFKILIFQKV